MSLKLSNDQEHLKRQLELKKLQVINLTFFLVIICDCKGAKL